jgi:hypothetical protein
VLDIKDAEEANAWSEVAACISCVSLLRFGGTSRPPDEDKVHRALTTFFEKAETTPRRGAKR